MNLLYHVDINYDLTLYRNIRILFNLAVRCRYLMFEMKRGSTPRSTQEGEFIELNNLSLVLLALFDSRLDWPAGEGVVDPAQGNA